MIRKLNAKELERLIAKYRKQLERTNGTGGDELARIGTRIERRIVRNMISGTGEVTEEQLQSFLRAIRQSVAMGDADFRELMDKHVPDVWATAVERTAETAALDAFSSRSFERVLEVADSFERAIESRTILRTSGGYTELWRSQWTEEWTKTARVIQAKFTGATITGESWSSVANGLVNELGTLEINGRMATEDFARAFVRTKFGELYNEAGVAIAREAGLDKFINVGVPDERQSEECYAASQAEAMTLEEWSASEYGPPLRHVFNCRCELVAVPDETVWEGQENPKFEEVAA